MNEEQLLNVLTNGATGRNPTFFKAFGHDHVFGLKSDIPEGCQTMEVKENVPHEDGDGPDAEENVLYAQLPADHPMILKTSSAASSPKEETKSEAPHLPPSLSFEEAVEQAELVFDIAAGEDKVVVESEDVVVPVVSEESKKLCEPIEVDVETSANSSLKLSSPSLAKRTSPRISPRIQSRQLQQISESASAKLDLDKSLDVTDGRKSSLVTTTTTKSPANTVISRHNLRPKRTLRHVNALKQQAKRRKKNTSIASGVSSPTQRTLSRRSSITSNGDIEIHYRPSLRSQQEHMSCPTMKSVLNSIPGFPPLWKFKQQNSSNSKKSSSKKVSLSAALQQVRDKTVDLESQDSILGQVNLRTLLNKATFLRLPPMYQYKLMGLLPQVDTVIEPKSKALR